MYQTDVSNTNSIFIPPSTPANHKEDQPEQDFNKALKTSIREISAFITALKQQQQQEKQIPSRKQGFSILEITSVEKE